MTTGSVNDVMAAMHTWVLIGQALVGSVGALAFVFAFASLNAMPARRSWEKSCMRLFERPRRDDQGSGSRVRGRGAPGRGRPGWEEDAE